MGVCIILQSDYLLFEDSDEMILLSDEFFIDDLIDIFGDGAAIQLTHRTIFIIRIQFSISIALAKKYKR